MKIPNLLIALFLLFLPSHLLAESAQTPSFAPSSSCKGCHSYIFEQYDSSMHKKSFSNPFFMAKLANEVLPAADKKMFTEKETKGCITCHAPVRMITKGIPSAAELKADEEGITCDFCHTITGIDEKMNFITDPEGKKLGPLKIENWHSKYSKYITTSAFCATCHNDWNRNNVEIKSTYSEWRRSKYAENNIQCQDCHMNSKGFLNSSGKAEYESGKAVYMSGIGNKQSHQHEKLYSHRFPGAHSKSQSESAFKLRMLGLDSACIPGERYSYALHVDNSKAGHSMPTGSTDLRLLWLEVFIETDNGRIPVEMPSLYKSGFDVAGRNAIDEVLFGNDIPKGARIYRTIFGDSERKPIASSFDSFTILFDNRLKQSEKRLEKFTVIFPAGLKQTVRLVSHLKYMSYPTAMARQLGVELPHVTILATTEKEITLVKGTPDSRS